MSISRVVIVHGYAAGPADHWFDWLARCAQADGADVLIPELPDPHAPDPERWIAAVSDAIGEPDAGTAVVAHSLGAVTALRALERTPGDWRLGALVAVAGFLDPLPELPQLDSFTDSDDARLDAGRVAARIAERTVILSDDDAIVPAAHTFALAAALDAETITVPGAGHFLAAEGITTLPQAAERLRGSRR